MIVSVGFPTGMEGLTYPIPFSEPDVLLSIAKHAEALGYHSIWGNDHMTTQNYVRAEFGRPPKTCPTALLAAKSGLPILRPQLSSA